MNVADVFVEGYRRMLAIGHRTFWYDSAAEQDGEPLRAFAFFSASPETAAKARAALEAAGVLCSTDLGDPHKPFRHGESP